MNTPICSVLIPSRKRFDRLIKSIRSFYDTADDANNFETIVRLHASCPGDTSRISEILAIDGAIKIIVGRDKTPLEYNNMLWNECDRIAVGTWRQYWSDDMVIEGKGGMLN